VLGLLTVLVFLLTATATAWIAWRLFAWRGKPVDRLVPQTRKVEAYLPSPILIWQELVDRVGAFLPASGRDLKLLQKRLIRAGLRHPGAVRLFTGSRGLLAAGGVLAAALFAPASKLFLLVAVAGVAGYMAPMQYLLHRVRRRKHAIEKGLPNALDLMVVCIESGLGLDQTTVQVAKELEHAHPEICDEFTMLNLELRAGKRRVEALHNLAERTGVNDLRKLVAVLIQADRFGTSIAQSLRGHADYMRVMARQRAEERASKLPVKLVFPIFFCILPALFVVTIGPALVRLVRDLIPMVENM
jgi:tight adherence protein C